MNPEQGRMGRAECTALTAASLCVNGLFAIDKDLAYADGNSTYIAVPAAMLVSLLPVIFVARAMRKKGASSLGELLYNTFGAVLSPFIALPAAASLIVCAVSPMMGFVRVLHSLVYDGATYAAILFFIFPITAFMAWKGFECLGRAALLLAGVFALSLAAAVVSAAPSFEIYRLFPIMGGSAADLLGLTASFSLLALPPLTAMLINGRGAYGPGRAAAYACRAALISAPVCAAAHLAAALIYPAGMLRSITMPLFRLGFLSLSQSYILRLDKLLIMIWLGACMLQSAYCIYSAGYLFAEVFRKRGSRAFTAVCSFAAFTAILIGSGACPVKAGRAGEIVSRYGALAAFVPLLPAAAAGFIKRGKGRKNA